MKLRQLRLLFFVLFTTFFLTHNGVSQTEVKPIQIDSSLYAITDIPGGNIAFLITPVGVLVVDAGNMPVDGEQIVKIIKSITDQPIKYLVLTHFHGDHVNGIAGFPDDIQIIAHENITINDEKFNQPNLESYIQVNMPEQMQKLKDEAIALGDSNEEEKKEIENQIKELEVYLDELKRIKPPVPNITFKEEFPIVMAEDTILLTYPGPGHTLCNITVDFINHHVIHTGDLIFNNMTPYVIPDHGAIVGDWILILDEMNEKIYHAVIPGHGDLTDNKGIQNQSEYFKLLWKRVSELKNDGLSLKEIQKDIDDGSYDSMVYQGQLSKNIEAIYIELDGN